MEEVEILLPEDDDEVEQFDFSKDDDDAEVEQFDFSKPKKAATVTSICCSCYFLSIIPTICHFSPSQFKNIGTIFPWKKREKVKLLVCHINLVVESTKMKSKHYFKTTSPPVGKAHFFCRIPHIRRHDAERVLRDARNSPGKN
jgi:hypothetical protein